MPGLLCLLGDRTSWPQVKHVLPVSVSTCKPCFPSKPSTQLQNVAKAQNNPQQARIRQKHVQHGQLKEDVAGVQPVVLPSISNPQQLEDDRRWISTAIATWLDEEWTPLQVHQDLGAAAAAAYCSIRQTGENDLGSILLAMSSELLSFNYRETFVNAFDVSNKVTEMLMMRMGCDVCCTTEADRARVKLIDTAINGACS